MTTIIDRLRNLFAAAPPPPPKPQLGGGQSLFAPFAVDQFANLLFALPDPDEILKKAGKNRQHLRELLGDDEISAALDTRRDAVIGTPWRLQGEDGDSTSERVEFLREQVERHFEDLVGAAWNAAPFGYSVIELVWERLDGRLGIKEAVEKPFEWFQPQRDGSLRYLRLGAGMGFTTGVEGVPVDTNYKFLLTRRQPSYRNPRGEALLSRVYWPWFLRSQGWRFWARFLERFGAPLLVGHTQGSVTEMRDALLQAVQSAVVAVSGTDAKVEAVSPGNAGEAFTRFTELVDKRIQKAILGQTLTTDSSGKGSFAQAKVHDGVREDRKAADVRMVTRTVQRFVSALSYYNFPGQPAPRFVMEAGEGLATDRADRDAKLVQAGVLRLTDQYLLDRYDFEEGDFEVPEPVAPPQLAKPGQRGAVPADEEEEEEGAQFAAVRQFAVRRRGRFTADQEAVEDLVDDALAAARSPVDPKKARSAVLAATSPQDLVERLTELAKDAPPGAFAELVERSLFAADLMGYAHVDDPRPAA